MPKCPTCGGPVDWIVIDNEQLGTSSRVPDDCPRCATRGYDRVPPIANELAELRRENERLRGLLEPCRADTDAQTDASYPKTVDDVLHLLSAYIADFLPPDVCPGDEYFAAWERQARRVVGPLMEELERLRGLLREAYRALREVQFDDEWMTRVRAALETSQ